MLFIAFAATVFYYFGYATWKQSVSRMPPLSGRRPFQIVYAGITSASWWAGCVLTVVGAGLQTVALAELPLAVAAPVFASSLVVLLAIALLGFGERMTGREWGCLGLFAAAMVLVALSTGEVSPGSDVPTGGVLTVWAGSLVVPILLFTVGDTHREGRHARPIAGVAYGLGVGLVAGTSELMIKAMSGLYLSGSSVSDIAASPYPYVLTTTAIVSWLMVGIALQRSRLAIVISIATIVAQTHLLLTGSFLYGEGLPASSNDVALRVLAVVLALSAALSFPRLSTAR